MSAGDSGASPEPETEPETETSADAIDPDVDLLVPAQRAETAGAHKWVVLAVIAAGGAAGSSARYGASLLWPTAEGAFPWTTLGVNALGCLLIGVLMVLVSGAEPPVHPLVRPFLGVGVLGGFTTFSTYALDISELLRRGETGTALGYLAGTAVGALGAVWAAATVTRRLAGRPAVRRGAVTGR
ncbi:fluoride efflux transporter FluC [Streptomyces sp. NPDC088116]|uniref:fluoride efflux transporter FluC n=1 Tax=Streptomyces sp. NPDC088116 TaxID=3365825 RepID=UPI003806AD16